VPTPQARTQDSKSIAVLPFVNMSSDKENEYFSDGNHEDLIAALSRVSGLHVAARRLPSPSKARTRHPHHRHAAQRGAVLEGSVAKAGNRVASRRSSSTSRMATISGPTPTTATCRHLRHRSQVAQTVAEGATSHARRRRTPAGRAKTDARTWRRISSISGRDFVNRSPKMDEEGTRPICSRPIALDPIALAPFGGPGPLTTSSVSGQAPDRRGA